MRLKGISILVVDDEQDLRETVIDIFRSEGATVSEAENGESAFELMRDRVFDVVMSDVRMPGGGGMDLLRRIDKKGGIKPKLFLCTGFSDISSDEANQLGVLDIFAKPFNFEILISSILRSFK